MLRCTEPANAPEVEREERQETDGISRVEQGKIKA
jgi:hypothetical protein